MMWYPITSQQATPTAPTQSHAHVISVYYCHLKIDSEIYIIGFIITLWLKLHCHIWSCMSPTTLSLSSWLVWWGWLSTHSLNNLCCHACLQFWQIFRKSGHVSTTLTKQRWYYDSWTSYAWLWYTWNSLFLYSSSYTHIGHIVYTWQLLIQVTLILF